MSGGGFGSICCPLNWSSLYHISRSSLNMLWIAHPSGNSSWNTSWPISFMILKGLYFFWSSFLEGYFDYIFSAFSNTLSLSFNPCGFCLFLLNCFFMASFAIFIDFFTTSQLSYSLSRKLSNFGNSVFTVRFPFYGCLPKLSLNEV